MTLEQIKAAVIAGKTVHWANPGYQVLRDQTVTPEQWLIVFTRTGNCIGLTWQDGVTMNGDESEFFIGE